LTKNFSKFLKKKGKDKTQSSKRYNFKKSTYSNYSNYSCFGCGKQGHIKIECPNATNKEKEYDMKFDKEGKGRRAYIFFISQELININGTLKGCPKTLIQKIQHQEHTLGHSISKSYTSKPLPLG